MKTRALLILCGASLALARAAVAEPAATVGTAAAAAEGLPPNRIVAIVRQTGFDPMGPPVRNGDLYTVRALDPYDVAYRIVIDARSGRTVSIREIATPGPFQAMPSFRRGDGPVYGRIFGAPSDNYGFGSPRPPREMPHANPSQQAQPPQQTQPQEQAKQTQPRPQQQHAQPSLRSAEVAPLPRPRPYVMEATGSIPVSAPNASDSKPSEIKASETKPPDIKAPQTKAAETKPSLRAGEPAKGNGAGAMPPVAPLD